MTKLEENRIRISVRNLVEFLLRSGDIDSRRKGKRDLDAMAAGAKMHRKIQARMGADYEAEVLLRTEFETEEIVIGLEGRADGLFTKDGILTVDEIKGVYWDLDSLEEPVPVHRAQAMCYAWMAAEREQLTGKVGIQLTYCHLETEKIRRFSEVVEVSEAEGFVRGLLEEYSRWGLFLYRHRLERNASARELEFPFPYRPGQRELAVSVYRTIQRGKTLYVQAPTGTGKTMSVLFPAVKALGEGLGDKIFYLTAKTITRTVAEEAMEILRKKGLRASSVTFTAREKLCPLVRAGGQAECNPEACPCAKGHYDRVNEAVFDYICRNERAGREEIERWAEAYRVCPHEFLLDLSDWVDVVICDYNYVFDPNVQLKRYFGEGPAGDYLFLVDEAHNLAERAREMYSAAVYKEEFLAAARLVRPYSPGLERKLKRCNRLLLEMKRESDGAVVRKSVDQFALALTGAFSEMEQFQEEFRVMDGNETYSSLYLSIRHFLNMYDRLDDSYCIYSEQVSRESFMLKLLCVNPAANLSLCLEKGVSTIFFSATLLPVQYYKEVLSGNQEEYAVYVPSPFDASRRLLAVGRDVSSRYKRRNSREYWKILNYILTAARARKGNYLVYFPSYAYMNEVYSLYQTMGEQQDVEIAVQSGNMKEDDREAFLEKFREKRERSLAAFCVMGGIFSEGIDLKGEQLIGVLIVGTGLAQICTEREILKTWYEDRGKDGFAYAYRYPGMNKVLQAAGRVIRTDTDEGIILLLDDRFLYGEYRRLFPREWSECHVTNYGNLSELLDTFWQKRRK
ncbi:MAG TPA: ATP-dependent DNA helicase [Firmicutes bacterium]|nr:ATP-dependent DNA helicase [Bacillota bacterium]